MALNRRGSVKYHVTVITKFPPDDGQSVAKIIARPGILTLKDWSERLPNTT